MALNDDLLSLSISYLDITDYRPEEITTLLLRTGCDNPKKIIDSWMKASIYQTIIEDRKIERKLNGKLHRTYGPAIEGSNGHKEWWVDGKRHLSDGPAIEWEECKEWWVDGKLHRTELNME